MSLAPGTRLGAYEVLALIGAGGMGEVYRARDSKLNRDLARKILPDAFANDSDRLARFTREAQAVGALTHPSCRPHLVDAKNVELYALSRWSDRKERLRR